jgi:hypothetical protein
LCDLGKDLREVKIRYGDLRNACTQGRRAPVVPSALEKELALKHFTNGKDDRPAVAKLYAEGVAARFGTVRALNNSSLGWGDNEAKALAAVLATGATPKLRQLYLYLIEIGDEGARALARALPSATALKELYLTSNRIGAEGARALVGALPSALKLKALILEFNSIGDETKAELRRACEEQSPKTFLQI